MKVRFAVAPGGRPADGAALAAFGDALEAGGFRRRVAVRLAQAVRAAGGEPLEALRRWEPRQLQLGAGLLARTRVAGNRLQSG